MSQGSFPVTLTRNKIDPHDEVYWREDWVKAGTFVMTEFISLFEWVTARFLKLYNADNLPVCTADFNATRGMFL